jgi:hypothetical protein
VTPQEIKNVQEYSTKERLWSFWDLLKLVIEHEMMMNCILNMNELLKFKGEKGHSCHKLKQCAAPKCSGFVSFDTCSLNHNILDRCKIPGNTVLAVDKVFVNLNKIMSWLEHEQNVLYVEIIYKHKDKL